MKKLLPSQHEKKRYLLIETNESSKMLDNAMLKFLGELGYAKASPLVIEKKDKYVVLAVNRKYVDDVITAFILSGRNVKIRLKSGTLKRIKEFLAR